MADIFISYSKKDRALVEQLAGLLQEVGFTVWWDADLIPAAEFREEIRRQIQVAKAVIVIWSESSAKSSFVIDEADLAREAGKLISTLADGFAVSRVPLGFRNAHMTALSDGEALIRALASRGLTANRPVSNFLLALFRDQIVALRRGRDWLLPITAALCAVIVAAVGGAYALQSWREEPRSSYDYRSAYFTFASHQEARPEFGMAGREPGIDLSYNGLRPVYIRKVRAHVLTSDLKVIQKDEDSTELYVKDYFGYSIKVSPAVERAIIAGGYVAACIDFTEREGGKISAIGIVRKLALQEMFRDRVHSVDFKPAEATAVAALSKEHLCDYRL